MATALFIFSIVLFHRRTHSSLRTLSIVGTRKPARYTRYLFAWPATQIIYKACHTRCQARELASTAVNVRFWRVSATPFSQWQMSDALRI